MGEGLTWGDSIRIKRSFIRQLLPLRYRPLPRLPRIFRSPEPPAPLLVHLSARSDTVVRGFRERSLDLIERGRPALGFGQVIWERDARVLRERRGVERVLGNGDENTGHVRGDEHVQNK